MHSRKSKPNGLWAKGTMSLALALAAGAWPAASPGAEQASVGTSSSCELAQVRVYFADKREAAKLFVGFEGAIRDTDYAAGYHLMSLTPAQLTQLTAQGYRIEQVPPTEVTKTVRSAAQSTSVSAVAPNATVSGIPYRSPLYSCFRTVDETFAAAQRMATEHPTLASWIDIGDSWVKAHGGSATDPALVGDDMMTLVLTNQAVTGDKPKLFLTSSIHGDEIATMELAMRFAEYLVGSYGTNADATWVLDHNEIHLLLATNPDARRLNESGSAFRKNRNDSQTDEYCSVGGYVGVDLNRNYSFQWDQCDAELICSYDRSPCGWTYIGASAGSEPETQAVMTRLGQLFPVGGRSGMFIDIHSYSELVLWPWGYTNQPPADNAALSTLGRKLAHFNNYYPEASHELYGTPGSSVDFAYGTLGLAAFTIELGKKKWEDCNYFETDILPKNLQTLMYAAKVARAPYELPAGPGAVSLALSKSVVLDDAPVTLTAVIDDRQLGVFGMETAQLIAAAEYYVDQTPWASGSSPATMAAADGTFGCRVDGTCDTQAALAASLAQELLTATLADRLADDPCKTPGQPPVGGSDPQWYVQTCQAFAQALEALQEPVTATIATDTLLTGRHMVYVRGRDSSGSWGPVTATYLTKTTLGDVNASGLADIVDALMIAQASVDMDPKGFIPEAADVNCDGSVNIVDALMVAQYSVKIIPALPGCGAN